jgi:hypothetical protein
MSFSLYGNHIPRCQHIKTNGTQCGSPALRRKRFCFFHNRWRATRLDLNRAGALRVTSTVELPVLEDADSIQVSLMQVMRLIICRQLDHKTGGLLLYGLQTASNNLRRIDFEHRHKPSIVIDPRSVRENGVGDQAWSPEDFADEEELQEEDRQEEDRQEEEDSAAADADVEDADVESVGVENACVVGARVERTCPESMSKELSPATLSPETTPAIQEKEWKEVQRLESALEGAKQGNWHDLKTVFELAGIFPSKDEAPPAITSKADEEAHYPMT